MKKNNDESRIPSSQELVREYKKYFNSSQGCMCDYDQSDFKKVNFYTEHKIVYQASISE